MLGRLQGVESGGFHRAEARKFPGRTRGRGGLRRRGTARKSDGRVQPALDFRSGVTYARLGRGGRDGREACRGGAASEAGDGAGLRAGGIAPHAAENQREDTQSLRRAQRSGLRHFHRERRNAPAGDAFGRRRNAEPLRIRRPSSPRPGEPLRYRQERNGGSLGMPHALRFR